MYQILYSDEKIATPVTPGAKSTTHADKVVAGTNEAVVNKTSSSEDKDKGVCVCL